MDELSITELEAELGCLEPSLPDSPPRQGHGSTDSFFDPPTEAISRLDPPSKGKSVYPFGKDGTLGWSSPAGELLCVASLVDNSLVGLEYKKSIQNGKEYYDRSKMLEKAVEAGLGSGYGIGVSLEEKLQPTSVSWIHNKWPRYTYEHKGLKIRLQYYTESHSIIQQYQIRNDSQEPLSLNYTVTSDICFIKHQWPPGPAEPVPSTQCPERLLLVGNSEVLIRNPSIKAQAETALFLNGQRQSLWANQTTIHDRRKSVEAVGKERKSVDSGRSVDTAGSEDIKGGLEQMEESIRRTIDEGKLLSSDDDFDFRRKYRRYFDNNRRRKSADPSQNDQQDFATHRKQLDVPAASTQELCLVVNISDFALGSDKTDDASSDTKRAEKGDSEEETFNVWEKQDQLSEKSSKFPLDRADLSKRRRTVGIVKDHLELGEACAKFDRIGEARYHFYSAYLIARYVSKDNASLWNQARLSYVRHLDDNGWYLSALNIVRDLVPDLFARGPQTNISDLWTEVIDRLGTILLSNRSFEEARALYERGFDHYSEDGPELSTTAAHFLERLAFTQVSLAHSMEARDNYLRLLSRQNSARHIVLSNLGFIERRLHHISAAESYYQQSLDEPESHDDVLARSGLCTCLRELNADIESIDNAWPTSIRYIDVNAVLSPPSSLEKPIIEGQFSFAILRQLECILSFCSIPIAGSSDPDSHAIALVDVDPLNCNHRSRAAYFQFRFLLQCFPLIDSRRDGDEMSMRDLKDRIYATCKGHLVWTSFIANDTPNQTWIRGYAVNGKFNRTDEEKLWAFSMEGAFYFLELYLFLDTWSEKWSFVLNLLHLKFEKWLRRLEKTQHMSNLWIEDEDDESFKPNVSTSDDAAEISRRYPHYDISHSTLIWQAISQVERMLKMIGNQLEMVEDTESTEMLKEIRESIESFQGSLSLQRIRDNILRTFKVPKVGLHTALPIDNNATLNTAVRSPNDASLSVQPTIATKTGSQVIAFQRNIKENVLEIKGHDSLVIEAALLGFFDGKQDQVDAAWRETIRAQKERDVETFADPRHLALVLFASRFKYNLASSQQGKVEDAVRKMLESSLYDSGFFGHLLEQDAPRPQRYWSAPARNYEAMSLLVGGLFKESREIFLLHGQHLHGQAQPDGLALLMTRSEPRMQISLSQPNAANHYSMYQKNVVDTDFLPEWMYRYPDFIHREKLEIKVREKLKLLPSIESLAPAIAAWKESEKFSAAPADEIPCEPGIVDSGVKKRVNSVQINEREIDIDYYWVRQEFWERLLEPRTPEKAKKRLLEISSQDKEAVLICWLVAPEEESALFLEFYRRHQSSESYFGERAHWRGNVWDTELHLGFHELTNIGQDRPSSEYRRRIKPVALSFRFMGDLRDQYWTCHFFSSMNDISERKGFHGFIDEYYYTDDSQDTLHAEKQGQRKVLEVAYVDRALKEMRRNIEIILDEFAKKPVAPEVKDLANASFSVIHETSSLFLQMRDELRSVSDQLDISLSTFEQWEKREETRGLRSRWSRKDEERHGAKLGRLTRQCRMTIQQLRVQQHRLRDHQRNAEQQHNNLISYKQLQEARASTQLASDVRVFTYVTIIFLPLSFSSSLFSMAGTPEGRTIAVMIPTTVIALTLTLLLLSNMKLMSRHWSFYLNKANANTRKKMENKTSPKWKQISKELEETTRRRLIKIDFDQRPLSESNWWYFTFWISHTCQVTKDWTLNKVRRQSTALSIKQPHKILATFFWAIICVLILIIPTTILFLKDAVHLAWEVSSQQAKKLVHKPKDQPPKETESKPGSKPDSKSGSKEKDETLSKEDTLIEEPQSNGPNKSFLRTLMTKLINGLESPPRPIKTYIDKKYHPPPKPTVEQDDTGGDDTATLNNPSIDEHPSKPTFAHRLGAATRSSFLSFVSLFRKASETEDENEKDGTDTADFAKQNGAQGGMASKGGKHARQGYGRRGLLRRSRPPEHEPETEREESRVWVGWASV